MPNKPFATTPGSARVGSPSGMRIGETIGADVIKAPIDYDPVAGCPAALAGGAMHDSPAAGASITPGPTPRLPSVFRK